MLVDNKFLFLKIPRTATVAFERSCFSAGLSITYPADNVLAQKQAEKGLEPYRHAHHSVSKLREYYGKDYPIVAISRDPLERFISAWKYTIKHIAERNPEVSKVLEGVTNQEFMNAWHSEIGYSANLKDIDKAVNFFRRLVKGGVPYNKNTFMIFTTIITGPIRWHENNPDIIYFDIKDLTKLEEYTKDITGKPFKLITINDTKSVYTNLKLDDSLKDFYFKIVEPVYKKQNTLI